MIDYLRIKLDKKYPNKTFTFYSFIFDQIIHILIIYVISLFYPFLNALGQRIFLDSYNMPFSYIYLSKIVFCILLVLYPTSVFIKHLFNYVFPSGCLDKVDICEELSENNVGSLIGKIERLIIIFLGLLGLYTSIAIVLTAKSIARYKQLENKEFAEKYLVGTLVSILIAILCLIFLRLQ